MFRDKKKGFFPVYLRTQGESSVKESISNLYIYKEIHNT